MPQYTPLTRRTFLKWIAATSAALTLPNIAARAQSGRTEVLVIGAGAAGLSAALTLQAADYDVTILEARDRVGGRILTDFSLAPFPVELGAEFIHGENVTTWDALEEYGLTGVEADSSDEYYFFDNQLYYEAPEVLNDLLGQIEFRIFTWLGNDTSIGSLLEDEDEALRTIANHSFTGSLGTDAEDVGLYGLFETFEADDGENDFRVVEGYTTLINAVAQNLDIRLENPVQSIVWDDDGVTATTRDGQEFSADYIIVTLPLAILKSDMVTFDPALPPEKLEAIAGLGAGKVNKIILQFSESPFDDDVSYLTTEGNSQFWWRAGVGDPSERHVWTALVAGDGAERHATLSDEEIIAEALEDIANLSETSIDELRELLGETRIMRWSSDEFSQMGYSFVPVGASGLREVLNQPVEDTIFFAGEATSILRPSSVHGAIETGIAAAEAIIEMG